MRAPYDRKAEAIRKCKGGVGIANNSTARGERKDEMSNRVARFQAD